MIFNRCVTYILVFIYLDLIIFQNEGRDLAQRVVSLETKLKELEASAAR
jgi:hypothetical protein